MKTKIYVVKNKLSFTRYGQFMIFPFSFTISDSDGTVSIFGLDESRNIQFQVSGTDFVDEFDNALDSSAVLDLLALYCFTGFNTPTGGSVGVSAQLLRTGQLISYGTGDDGDSQRGRGFFLLDETDPGETNPFGNNYRHTDDLGLQLYANDIVLDWSTYCSKTSKVLAYKKTPTTGTLSWDELLTTINALNVAGFVGWELWNVREMQNLMCYDLPYVFNYSPFNIGETYFYCSTSYTTNTDYAFFSYASYGEIQKTVKNQTFGGIAVRIFTLTELGL